MRHVKKHKKYYIMGAIAMGVGGALWYTMEQQATESLPKSESSNTGYSVAPIINNDEKDMRVNQSISNSKSNSIASVNNNSNNASKENPNKAISSSAKNPIFVEGENRVSTRARGTETEK